MRKNSRLDPEICNDHTSLSNTEDSSKFKIKKIKLAMIIGYIGSKYYGLQYNKLTEDLPTVEAALVKALFESGFISNVNMDNDVMDKIHWQRASRTDKGVHAIQNVVNVKLILPSSANFIDQNFSEYVLKLNNYLPLDIRCYSFIPVTNKFSSYLFCTSRVYEYYLPTYAMLSSDIYEKLFVHEEKNIEISDHKISSILLETYNILKKYRISNELLQKARKYAESFCGSHKFHNYTVKTGPNKYGVKDGNDATTYRYIQKVSITDPHIIRNTEWVLIRFTGQSFLQYQIRKMVGALLISLVKNVNSEFLSETLKPSLKLLVPTAPSNGLLLKTLYFNRYNQYLENIQNQSKGVCAVGKQPLNLDCKQSWNTELQKMRKEIEDTIFNIEHNEQLMASWIWLTKQKFEKIWNIPTNN